MVKAALPSRRVDLAQFGKAERKALEMLWEEDPQSGFQASPWSSWTRMTPRARRSAQPPGNGMLAWETEQPASQPDAQPGSQSPPPHPRLLARQRSPRLRKDPSL